LLDVIQIVLENGYPDLAEHFATRIRSLGMNVQITVQPPAPLQPEGSRRTRV